MRIKAVKYLGLVTFLVVGLLIQGCSNMSTTDRRIGTGAGIGAVTGALISGGRPGATAAGAIIGAGAGYVYDREKKKRYYRGRYYRY